MTTKDLAEIRRIFHRAVEIAHKRGIVFTPRITMTLYRNCELRYAQANGFII